MKTNLQRIRKDRGFKSAKEFAEKHGYNVGTYTNHEQGVKNMSLETAWNYADDLECTLDELAGRDWPRPQYQDPRQEKLNGCFESLNDESKTEIAGMVASIAADPARRIEKERQMENLKEVGAA